MTSTPEKIPFAIEMSRVIELLAKQIYPSPFALLRENVQNSFDAILLRRHSRADFVPAINLIIEPLRVKITDNGIGMSREDLRNHFWRAGSSSKNTDEARAAGVVGTFGIGAMANFGIAENLTVTSESARSGERTFCSASLSTLSVTEDCIIFEAREPTGSPGTVIEANIQADKPINVAQAEAYISEFVAFLPIAVTVNGRNASGGAVSDSVPALVASWSYEEERADFGGGLQASVKITGAITGEVRVEMTDVSYGGQALPGRMTVRQGINSLRTFRSGFGLATAGVSSAYQFGGIADFLFLEPTAGREALTTPSLQILQNMISRIDDFVSIRLATRPESNANNFFVNWAARQNRYELCGKLRVRIEPGDSQLLEEVRNLSVSQPVLVYAGTDNTTVEHASADRPLIMLSRNNQRRECEIGYLRKFCKIEEMEDKPSVLTVKPERTFTSEEQALVFRLASILSSDYFIEVNIRLGTISHGVPILVTSRKPPLEIFINPTAPTARMLIDLYEREYIAFGHMAKDFVRTMIFPKVSDLVPSATKQGAEAFLKSISRSREIFEYEADDLESLTSVWDDYMGGKMNFAQAVDKSSGLARRSFQVVDSAAAGPVRDVVPDVIENESSLPAAEPNHDALPPFERLDVRTDRKLLTIADNETPLKGYRCFLALTDKVWEEKGEFFLQPHRTSVVWGGQRALFIFEHHSEEFGLYYELQTQSPLSIKSGGGAFETSTIVMKNRVFIPIPPEIQASFLPASGEKKRFEIRCDILYIDHADAAAAL
ncbi:ATP-binding protein [Mesorhizobium sp. M1322]|uniref:ATP-binding protein n=1 Tax=Mesorhizobium sp. M1322 TaxID=2957081 RepID=UPI00333CDF8E